MSWRCQGRRPQLIPVDCTEQAPHRDQGQPDGRTHEKKRPHSSWVATRRGLHKPVSSSPPFKTGLAPLRASGLTPLVDSMGDTMKRLYPFLQLHRRPPVDSLRVRWVSLFPSQTRFPVSTRFLVVSLNVRDEVLSAEYHKLRASQGMKVP